VQGSQRTQKKHLLVITKQLRKQPFLFPKHSSKVENDVIFPMHSLKIESDQALRAPVHALPFPCSVLDDEFATPPQHYTASAFFSSSHTHMLSCTQPGKPISVIRLLAQKKSCLSATLMCFNTARPARHWAQLLTIQSDRTTTT